MNDQTLLELVRSADPLSADLGRPPRALVERVLASPRADREPRRIDGWQAKVALGAVVFGVSGVIAALAIAGTGWLTGEPAPPQVVTNFQLYTPQLGFHPDPGKAVLVARDGDVELYATTDREGTYCLDVVAPWKPATVHDGGTCVTQSVASGDFVAGVVSGSPVTEQGMTFVVGGRVADPKARSVRFDDPGGNTVTQPLGSSGFFLSTVTMSGPCATGNWSSTFTALDSAGNALAHTGTIPLAELSEHDSARSGPIRSCLVRFLQR